MTGSEKTQIIVTGTALLIEQIPNAIEAAIRIKKLLAEMGVQANVHTINQQALEAATATEALIAEFNEKFPPYLAEDED